MALSSAESELHALVSSVADGIYICRCLEFSVDFPIKHVALIDNAAACSLANKRGVGKILWQTKEVWIQDKTENGELRVERVESALNISDLGTKPLTAVRLKTLSFLLGAMDVASGECVGQANYEGMMQKVWHGSKVTKIAKVILRLAVLSDSMVVAGSFGGEDLGICYPKDDPGLVATSWSWTSLATMRIGLAIIAVLLGCYFMKKFNEMASDILALEGRVNTMNEQWGNVLQWPMERLLICRPIPRICGQALWK